jgi:hypothetical protein
MKFLECQIEVTIGVMNTYTDNDRHDSHAIFLQTDIYTEIVGTPCIKQQNRDSTVTARWLRVGGTRLPALLRENVVSAWITASA